MKKLGSSKLKLVDIRIESKTESTIQRVEFASESKEPTVTEHCFVKFDHTSTGMDQVRVITVQKTISFDNILER